MDFSNRYTKFGLKPFWFWNGSMEDDEIARQICEMKQKGIGGFFIHPRQGLEIPYMSEQWFDKVGIAVEEAKKNQLEVWLYDEYPYPSGIGGGEVIVGHPEYEAHTLKTKTIDVEGPQVINIELEWGKVLNAVACPIKDNSPIWQQSIDISECIGIIHTDKVFQHGGSSQYSNKRYFTAKLGKKLIWSVPKGKWRIYIFVECRVTDFKYYGTFIDSLNKDAIARFIQVTHEKYKKHFGSEFGKTIKGIFCDETAPFGRDFPWSALLPKLFEEQNGYSLVDNLPALIDDIGPMTNSIRYNYWNTTVNTFIESFDKQIHEWCSSNNLLYTGEKNILRSSQVQHMDIPGIDAGHHKTGTEAGIADSRYRANGKLLSSACHFYQKETALCECFHSVGWSMTIQDMKWMLDWLCHQGVNMFVPHAYFYTTDGLKKYDAPPSEFYQMPWWKHMLNLSDYLVDLLDIITPAERVVDILVMDPVTSTWTAMGEKSHLLGRLREDFSKLQKTLLTEHLDYYIIDPQLLAQAKIENSNINVNGEEYGVLIIPPTLNIEQCTWEIITKYINNGGIVIFTGCLPIETIDGFDGAKDLLNDLFGIDCEQIYNQYTMESNTVNMESIRRNNVYFVPQIKDVPNTALKYVDNSIRIQTGNKTNKKLLSTVYQNKSEKIFFLLNTSDDKFTTNIELKNVKDKAIYDITPGNKEAKRQIPLLEKDGCEYITLQFEPFQSYVLISNQNENEKNVEIHSPDEVKKINLDISSDWNVKLKGLNPLRFGSWKLDISVPLKKGGYFSVSSKDNVYCRPLINQIVEGDIALPIQTKPGGFGCVRDIILTEMDCKYTTGFFMDNNYSAWLVMEPESAEGDWYIILNGNKITKDQFIEKEFYLRTNLGVDVSSFLKKGENILEFHLFSQNKSGGLLNPLYLFGDFGVFKNIDDTWHIGDIKCKSSINKRTECGIPFYAGDIIYSMDIEINSLDANSIYEFCIDDKAFQESATLYVNGNNAGAVCWSPYVWHVCGAKLRQGCNNVQLHVSNTLLGLFDGQSIVPGENKFIEL